MAGPWLRRGQPDPLRWVSHCAAAAAEVMGHALLRRDGWTAEDLAAAGLGLMLRDPDNGDWTTHKRGYLIYWLFNPARPEAEVVDVLSFAASNGMWCCYNG